MIQRKRQRTSLRFVKTKPDLFDQLPDDVIVSVLALLSHMASSPSDLISVRLTCRRLYRLGLHPMVLRKAGGRAFDINAEKWSESAHGFLRLCVAAGNVEACYTLGMIRFYCLENREVGASLMARAAMQSHAPALYSLAVIHFNGSGRAKNRKDLRAGASLCARAACLGHVDALRELGHCLQDGYGVRQHVALGRHLLIHANAWELAASSVKPTVIPPSLSLTWRLHRLNDLTVWPRIMVCPILGDYGCHVPVPEKHPANRFIVRWFSGRTRALGLNLCSQLECGRPETRPDEFRRCSVCNTVSYCSRGCQAQDWKMRHKEQCGPPGDGNGNGVAGVNGVEEHEIEDPAAGRVNT